MCRFTLLPTRSRSPYGGHLARATATRQMRGSSKPMCHNVTKPYRLRPMATILAAAVSALSLSGCGRPNRAERFVPAEDVARQALSKAMTAWQNGGGTTLSLDGQTVVEVVDQHRRPGQSLSGFKILGQVSGIGGRSFEVKLELENPPQ